VRSTRALGRARSVRAPHLPRAPECARKSFEFEAIRAAVTTREIPR